MTITRLQPVRTPDGVFPTIKAAAEHYKVDRSTIRNRILKITPGWEWAEQTRTVRTGHSAPHLLSGSRAASTGQWSEYRVKDYDTREAIWQAWCAKEGHDPEVAQHDPDIAEQFISGMWDENTMMADLAADLESELEADAPSPDQ